MFILIKKSCVEFVFIWNKFVYMEMKVFQRGGVFCIFVNRKFNVVFFKCVDLCVEFKIRGILDVRYMLILYFLDLLLNKGIFWVLKFLGLFMDFNRLNMSLVVLVVLWVICLQWSVSLVVDKCFMILFFEGFWMYCWIILVCLVGFSKFQISFILFEDVLV